MNATIEDALVEWYETERVARSMSADARRGDVVDLDTFRPRQNPALARLFGAIEQTVESLSLIRPVEASDCPVMKMPRLVSDQGARA